MFANFPIDFFHVTFQACFHCDYRVCLCVFDVIAAYASVTTSQYIDVTLGIRDESVFVPPSICQRPVRTIGLPTRAQSIEEQPLQHQANHVSYNGRVILTHKHN